MGVFVIFIICVYFSPTPFHLLGGGCGSSPKNGWRKMALGKGPEEDTRKGIFLMKVVSCLGASHFSFATQKYFQPQLQNFQGSFGEQSFLFFIFFCVEKFFIFLEVKRDVACSVVSSVLELIFMEKPTSCGVACEAASRTFAKIRTKCNGGMIFGVGLENCAIIFMLFLVGKKKLSITNN